MDKIRIVSIVAGSCVILALTCYSIYKRKQNNLVRNALRKTKIYVLTSTTPKLNVFFEKLLSHVNEYPVLGFDCEWISESKQRNSVALLQLATFKDFCVLIRLNTFVDLPDMLKKILADPTIIKVGVAPTQDAKYLYQDYGIEVAGCLDLRHLTNENHGLAKLAKKYLNFTLNKSRRLRCSNWEANELNEDQIAYAALDAIVAVELYKVLNTNLHKDHMNIYLDTKFTENRSNNFKMKMDCGSRRKKLRDSTVCARKNPLYSNCVMQAPDGDILCTCDRKKADWYIEKNLAEKIEDNPFTIRLLFEPAGRAVGEVGKYYTKAKENICVVCGRPDSYIRKNVVPREYRKLFPAVMKDHTSHDVLLLCIQCHQKSNIADLKLREYLARLCNAPIGTDCDVKQYHSPAGRELKSAARALLNCADKLPIKRKQELNEIVLKYFPNETEVTDLMLKAALYVKTTVENTEYEPHGKKVIEYFISNCNISNDCKEQPGTGGLIELEQLWREHFLKTMQPKFLPDLWSVTHNKHRLELRAVEGRVASDDLKKAGCDESILINTVDPIEAINST